MKSIKMTSIILASALLTSCHPETVLPTCDWIEAVQVGKKVKIKIHSDQPRTQLCIDDRCTWIDSHYYGCVSVSVDPGQVVTVGGECVVEVR
jgi:hypothetical protein